MKLTGLATKPIPVDKEQALHDAAALLNGDADAYREVDFADLIEKHYDPDDDRKDPTPRSYGLFMMTDIELVTVHQHWDGDTIDLAEAIARSGLHIVGLLQENELLLAGRDKDQFDLYQRMLHQLKRLRDIHRFVLRAIAPSLGLRGDKFPVIEAADAVIAEAEGKR